MLGAKLDAADEIFAWPCVENSACESRLISELAPLFNRRGEGAVGVMSPKEITRQFSIEKDRLKTIARRTRALARKRIAVDALEQSLLAQENVLANREARLQHRLNRGWASKTPARKEKTPA